MSPLSRRFLTVLSLIAFLGVAPTFGRSLETTEPPASASDEDVDRILAKIQANPQVINPEHFEELAKLGTQASFDALVRLAKMMQNTTSAGMAYRAFRLYKDKGDLEQQSIAHLAEQCESGRDALRHGASEALTLFGEKAAKECANLLKRSKDEVVRGWVLGPLLPQLKAEGSSDSLNQILDNALVGRTATGGDLKVVMTGFQGAANDAVFVSAIKNKKIDDEVRALTIEAVGERDVDDMEKTLVAVIKEKSPRLQLAAIEALDNRHATSHMATLARLVKSGDELVRRQAVISIGRVRGTEESWVEELADLVKDKSPSARMGAIVALADVRTPAALELLYPLLSDPDRAVSSEALQQIANLRRKETLPHLIARLNAAKGRFRYELLASLRLITGLDNGTSQERWKNWWDNEGEKFTVPSYDSAAASEYERNKRRSEGTTISSFYGLQIVSSRICFIMDVSGSMKGKSGDATRIDAAKRELSNVLESYPDDDLFNVIFFSDDTYPWADELVRMDDKSRKESLSYVSRQEANGATALYDALKLAFEDRRIDTIILLTDGTPSGGAVDDPEQILKEVKLWNAVRHIRIDCISVGGGGNKLLQELAKSSNGTFKQVQ